VGAEFPRRFPTVFDACRRHGLDPRVQPIPVTPAAHYHLGGVHVDSRGRSSLDGLWACGEVACTGVHGANRLASNSLLEALVFGANVVEDIRGAALERPGGLRVPARNLRATDDDMPTPGATFADGVARVRQLMWDHVGLVRTGPGLQSAIRELASIEAASRARRVRDFALLGRLLATSALVREESRGGHYRADAPTTRDQWRRRSFVRLGVDGRVEVLAGPPVAIGNHALRPRIARGSAA
jgi:L-aspartate oxidase